MLGSTTAPGRPSARAGAPGHVAFHSMHSVGVPVVLFSRLNTQPIRTLSTLHRNPRGFRRMTRGQCGSLHLHWKRLSLLLLAGLPAHALRGGPVQRSSWHAYRAAPSQEKGAKKVDSTELS